MSSDGFGTVFVPKGVAHGFQALEDTVIYYISSSAYNKEFDVGININSFNINWPLINPIISTRDLLLPHLSTIDLF
jgi:dTDP-4-dehydrorhamnose 3,5-epimerase